MPITFDPPASHVERIGGRIGYKALQMDLRVFLKEHLLGMPKQERSDTASVLIDVHEQQVE